MKTEPLTTINKHVQLKGFIESNPVIIKSPIFKKYKIIKSPKTKTWKTPHMHTGNDALVF